MIGGTRVPQVKEETVAVNRPPEEADGLTVAVLADLHVDGITREERIRKIVERTNALNPDIVVIAGDFVDGTVPVHGGDLRPLADLKARYGVFGVPGNHESITPVMRSGWSSCPPWAFVCFLMNTRRREGRPWYWPV